MNTRVAVENTLSRRQLKERYLCYGKYILV